MKIVLFIYLSSNNNQFIEIENEYKYCFVMGMWVSFKMMISNLFTFLIIFNMALCLCIIFNQNWVKIEFENTSISNRYKL